MLGKRMHSNGKAGVFGRSSGKGKDILPKTSTSRYSKTQISENSDLDANVNFPYIRLTDNSEQLACYASVITRSSEEGIGMKDLDQLQQEFEKLLSVSAVRSRLLNTELEFLDRVEDRYEKKGKVFDKPPSPKHRKIEEKIKQTKDTKPTYKLVKERNFHDELPKLEAPKVILPKNDTKSKFWLSVDSYCSPVGGDDSAYLNELLDEMNQDIALKLCEVGQHYTDQWKVESRPSVPGGTVPLPITVQIKNKLHPTCTVTGNGANRFKSSSGGGSNSIILPLASALLEENITKLPSQEKLKELGMNMNINGNSNGSPNTVCLDKRLRNELAELGILDLEDNQNKDDEIAQEIKLCHQELSKLNANNIKELNRLRHTVNNDITRQEYIRKLDEVDHKIMDIYNNLLTSTPKDKNNTEWEAVRILKVQKELHKETMEMSNPNLLS